MKCLLPSESFKVCSLVHLLLFQLELTQSTSVFIVKYTTFVNTRNPKTEAPEKVKLGLPKADETLACLPASKDSANLKTVFFPECVADSACKLTFTDTNEDLNVDVSLFTKSIF